MHINFKRTLVVIIDIVIAVYLLMAVTVFNEPEDKATVCTEVNIQVDDNQNGFLSPADVKHLLERQRLYPLAQPLQFVSTRDIEESLMKNPYIETAECYKTQNGHVRVCLTQRQPVLHVMADSGEQYYVDVHGDILPSGRQAGNLIVATGSVNRKYASQRLLPVVQQILDDPFWQA